MNCAQCNAEPAVAVVAFHHFREYYPLGARCHASWHNTAQSLGATINNPAKVHMAFRRWQAESAPTAVRPAAPVAL